MIETNQPDSKYLALILKKLEVCKVYRPKFGQKTPSTLEDFSNLYGGDMFYSWIGLNNPLLYAAHKAAGGLTSLYRQIGIGCEGIVKHILKDCLSLSSEQTTWSYSKEIPGRKKLNLLTLDGRIPIAEIMDSVARAKVESWMEKAVQRASVQPDVAHALKGPVFEVRQGYKSKDSKRQNADIGNAGTAYSQGWFPVVMMLSNQIDGDVAEAYQRSNWLLLRGVPTEDPTVSTYAFFKEVLGYDLAGFFERNSKSITEKVEEVLKALLSPDVPHVSAEVLQELEEQDFIH